MWDLGINKNVRCPDGRNNTSFSKTEKLEKKQRNLGTIITTVAVFWSEGSTYDVMVRLAFSNRYYIRHQIVLIRCGTSVVHITCFYKPGQPSHRPSAMRRPRISS